MRDKGTDDGFDIDEKRKELGSDVPEAKVIGLSELNFDAPE